MLGKIFEKKSLIIMDKLYFFYKRLFLRDFLWRNPNYANTYFKSKHHPSRHCFKFSISLHTYLQILWYKCEETFPPIPLSKAGDDEERFHDTYHSQNTRECKNLLTAWERWRRMVFFGIILVLSFSLPSYGNPERARALVVWKSSGVPCHILPARRGGVWGNEITIWSDSDPRLCGESFILVLNYDDATAAERKSYERDSAKISRTESAVWGS